MSDVGVSDVGPSFSPEEEAFFSSGGNSAIPDAGAGDAGSGAGKVEGAEVPGADKTVEKPAADKVEKMVSLSALHEERTARKARDAELREAREKIANFEGRFAIIDRLNKPAEEKTKAPLTAEEDIFGKVNATGETVAQIQKRMDDADAATKAAETATTERNTFVTNYKNDAATFEKATPDYRKAYDFILNSRAAELKAIGYDTPEALHNALNADEMGIAEMAFSKGKSPAEMLYALAVQRGYKKAEAPKVGDGEPDPDVKPGNAAERLAKIAEGQAANKSLGDLGGEAPGGAMTAAQLLAMPMEEFAVWTEKNPAKAKRLMGGG